MSRIGRIESFRTQRSRCGCRRKITARSRYCNARDEPRCSPLQASRSQLFKGTASHRSQDLQRCLLHSHRHLHRLRKTTAMSFQPPPPRGQFQPPPPKRAAAGGFAPPPPGGPRQGQGFAPPPPQQSNRFAPPPPKPAGVGFAPPPGPGGVGVNQLNQKMGGMSFRPPPGGGPPG